MPESPHQQHSQDRLVRVAASNKLNADKWYYVTNQKNLQFLLAGGMLLPKYGYGKKHYRDLLDSCGDYLPFFKNRIPRETLSLVISERSSLFTVVLEMDLSALDGVVYVPQLLGGTHSRQFASQLDDGDSQIFVRAPLPTHWIKKIIVADKAQKHTLETQAGEVANVPLQQFSLVTGKKLLAGAVSDRFYPELAVPHEHDVRGCAAANVAGGVLAAIALFIDIGDVGVLVNRLVYDAAVSATDASDSQAVSGAPLVSSTPDAALQALDNDPVFATLVSWLSRADCEGNIAQPGARLFWRVVEALVGWHANGRVGAANDALLHSVERSLSDLAETEKSSAAEFIADLRGLHGLGDDRAESLLHKNPTALRRAFLLSLLVADIDDLVALYADKRFECLSATDILAAAVLVGARQGWQALPTAQRSPAARVAAIQHRMALVAHRVEGSDLSLGAVPGRELGLLELMATNANGKLGQRQQAAALQLARAMNWDCVETSVTLPDDAYQLQSRAGKLSLLTRAQVRVETRVNLADFMVQLKAHQHDAGVVAQLRLLLT